MNRVAVQWEGPGRAADPRAGVRGRLGGDEVVILEQSARGIWPMAALGILQAAS